MKGPRKFIGTVAGGLSRLLTNVQALTSKTEKEPALFWGMRWLPFSDAAQRFLVVGSPGSGKTTLLELLMRSVLGYVVTPGFNHRALIYDAKRDMLPILARMGLTVETKNREFPEARTLNPFDKRGFAWDLAKDIDCPAAALQVATILIPRDNSSQPFFTDAARQLLYAVMLSFLAKDIKDWSLRHVLLILKDERRLREVIRNSVYTRDLEAPYFSEKRVTADVTSTIATKLLPLEIVAALWDQARKEGRSLSLVDWVHGNYILVLGSHPSNRAALEAINQAIFRRITDLLLTQSEENNHSVTGRKTWLFLDEVREAGRLDGLSSLLNQGRSKGVCTVLGFQDIEGLRLVYGNQEAHEIVGQCDNKTVLRTESYPTAKWAEEHFGQSLLSERTTSESVARGREGTTHTHGLNERIEVRSAILASEFMMLPRRGPSLVGCHDVTLVGTYWAKLDWKEIEEARSQTLLGRQAPEKEVLGEEPQATHYQFLEPWGSDDPDLGIPEPVEQPREDSSKQQKSDEKAEGPAIKVRRLSH